MTKNNWYQEIITQEKTRQPKYGKRAILAYLSNYLTELDKRIDQKESQIDGELWNHEEW